jgi:hypothetical protein
MKQLLSAACLLTALIAHPVRADLDAVEDLGVRMNDWSFDNGKVISDAIRSGRVNDGIDFPGGVVHHSTTIDLGQRSGLSIRGNGVTHRAREAAYTARNLGNAATRFVYTGPPDRPAWKYSGVGLKLDGIVIQRGTDPGPEGQPPRDGSVGFLMEKSTAGPPTGKVHWGAICFFGWDLAFEIRGNSHCDNSAVDWVWFHDCWTAVRCDNSQAVNWDWQFVKYNGHTETMFDMVAGGAWRVSMLALDNPALIWRLHQTRSNSCLYEIGLLKIDNHASGWRLVEQIKPGGLRLRVGGIIGKACPPGENPIDLKPLVIRGVTYSQDIEIDLYWNGGRWPADFAQAGGSAEAPKEVQP